MIVMKIFEMNCEVVDEKNCENFEKVLALLMVPIQNYDAATDTYTVHVTFKMWSYILRECRFRDIELRLSEKKVVNLEEYQAYKAYQRTNKKKKIN